jgi:hypothetical protein
VGAVVIFANPVNLEGDTMANGTSSLDFTGMSLLDVANSYERRITNTDLKNTHLERLPNTDQPKTNIETEIQLLEVSKKPLNFIKNHTEENRLVGQVLAHCFKHACTPFLENRNKEITSDNIVMPAGGTHQLLQKFIDARAFAASQALRILADIPAIKDNKNPEVTQAFLREFDAKCQTGLIAVLKLLIEISTDRRQADRDANATAIDALTHQESLSSSDHLAAADLERVANSYERRITNCDLQNDHLEKRTFAEKPRTNIETEIQCLEASNTPLNFIKNHTEENSLVGKILAHCFKHACAPFLKDPEKPITSDNIKMPAGGTHELLQKFTDARAFAASQALRILADIPAIKDNKNPEVTQAFLREFDAKCQKGLVEVLNLLIEISTDRRHADRQENATAIASLTPQESSPSSGGGSSETAFLARFVEREY